MDPGSEDDTAARGSLDPRLEEVVDFILARLRAGERPSVEECVARYPEAGERIKRLLSGMLLIEEARIREAAAQAANVEKVRVTGDKGSRDLQGRLLRLGEYRLLHEVGRGGMGVVYEAIQESLGRRVALKILPYYSLLDPRLIERFRREAKAAAKLQHPNIVPVYGFGEDGSSENAERGLIHYYAMQFVEGRGLEQVLREVRRLRGVEHGELDTHQTPAPDPLTSSVALGLLSGWPSADRASREGSAPSMPAPRTAGTGSRSLFRSASRRASAVLAPAPPQYYSAVARLGQQAAEALDYAHESGIFHRDIKPSNLLLDPSGKVWITDFGLAKDESLADLTGPGEILGTLRYMAPEQLQGHADRRSDVYSLGMTVYELLTLRPAFEGGERKRLLQQILAEDPSNPRDSDPSIPREIESIVLKAIQKDPLDRYATARELALDLDRFQKGQRVSASSGTMGYLARRLVKRHRFTTVILCVVLLALPAYFSWSRLDARRAKNPNNVVVADFDGDGDLDLATSNFSSANVSVVLDPGRIGTDAETYPVGGQPDGLVAADWDQDGMLDLAVADTYAKAKTVSMLRNLGRGRFGLRKTIDLQHVLFQMTAADLDGDARADLAGAASPNNVFILRNLGGGSFAAPDFLDVAPTVNGILAIDCCRGDGNVDLVTADPYPKTISVLENTGGGHFSKPRHFNCGAMAVRLAAADLDGDGDLDIASANYGTWDASVLLRNADGTFTEPRLLPTGMYIQCVAAADLDGDGDADLVVGGNHKQDSLAFLRNAGDGTFPGTDLLPVPGGPTSVVALDWDGDGDLDLLATATQSGVVCLLLNRGDGTFGQGEQINLSPSW